MPADLKAILHTWAHRVVGHVFLGDYELDKKRLGVLDNWNHLVDIDKLSLDKQRAVEVGVGPYGMPLFAIWEAGDEWFRRRYPSALARLAYTRRKMAEASHTRILVQQGDSNTQRR